MVSLVTLEPGLMCVKEEKEGMPVSSPALSCAKMHVLVVMQGGRDELEFY